MSDDEGTNSLKEHLIGMFAINLNKAIATDPGQTSVLTDIDVELTFETSAVPGGYLQRINDKSFKIVLNEGFIESLGALIASLLVMVDELSIEIKDLTFKSNAPLEKMRKTVQKFLGGHGARTYWEELLPKHAENVYTSILEVMSRASTLRVKIATHALFATCTFLALHEACHAYGGHLAYRRRFIGSLRQSDDTAALGCLREDQRSLEMVCDISPRPHLFGMMAANDVAFEGHVEFSRVSKADFYPALYCCGFSVGFGLAVLFLLTDALALNSSDDYHPSSLERMTLISGELFSTCLAVPTGDDAEKLIGYLYHLGEFHGLRKCLDIWDTLGLERRHDRVFEEFFRSEKPCVLCNPSAQAIINRYRAVSEKLMPIKSRMDAWGISDKGNESFLTNLDYLASRYSELVNSREQHIAAQRAHAAATPTTGKEVGCLEG